MPDLFPLDLFPPQVAVQPECEQQGRPRTPVFQPRHFHGFAGRPRGPVQHPLHPCRFRPLQMIPEGHLFIKALFILLYLFIYLKHIVIWFIFRLVAWYPNKYKPPLTVSLSYNFGLICFLFTLIFRSFRKLFDIVRSGLLKCCVNTLLGFSYPIFNFWFIL